MGKLTDEWLFDKILGNLDSRIPEPFISCWCQETLVSLHSTVCKEVRATPHQKKEQIKQLNREFCNSMGSTNN